MDEPLTLSNDEEVEETKKSPTPTTTEVAQPSIRYTNKQRVLILCGRGINARHRHLMDDLKLLIPHHKKDNKLDTKDHLAVVNEIAEMKGCNSTLFLETRNRNDLYLWACKTPNGPSIKFRVLNVHTMSELRMTGNCMLGLKKRNFEIV